MVYTSPINFKFFETDIFFYCQAKFQINCDQSSMDKIARTEECLPIDVWEFPGFLCDFISVNIILVLLPASRFLVTNHFCVTFVLFKNCLDTSKLVRRYVKREATNQTKFLTTFQFHVVGTLTFKL